MTKHKSEKSGIVWKAESYPRDSHAAFFEGYELGVGPSYAHKSQMAWNVRRIDEPWDKAKITVCADAAEGKRLAEAEVRRLIAQK